MAAAAKLGNEDFIKACPASTLERLPLSCRKISFIQGKAIVRNIILLSDFIVSIGREFQANTAQSQYSFYRNAVLYSNNMKKRMIKYPSLNRPIFTKSFINTHC